MVKLRGLVNSLKGHLDNQDFFLGSSISVVDVAIYIELDHLLQINDFELSRWGDIFDGDLAKKM